MAAEILYEFGHLFHFEIFIEHGPQLVEVKGIYASVVVVLNPDHLKFLRNEVGTLDKDHCRDHNIAVSCAQESSREWVPVLENVFWGDSQVS